MNKFAMSPNDPASLDTAVPMLDSVIDTLYLDDAVDMEFIEIISDDLEYWDDEY